MSPRPHRRLRALIVDDEALARERIRSLLQAHPDIEIHAELGDGTSALEALMTDAIDLLFLDVQMPEKDGFEVLAMLEARRETGAAIQIPAVVFVTAYDHYALRAFEVHAADYLLKPFDVERFQKTLERVVGEISQKKAHERERRVLEVLAERDRIAPTPHRFIVKSRGRTVFVPTDDIDWIESAGNYVSLHVGAKDHLIRETMGGVASRLDADRFVRIHRSAIVRLDRVAELAPAERGDYQVRLRDGTRLPVSRRYYKNLRRKLERLFR